MMRAISDIIEELGGATRVSAETGIPLTTIYSWKRNGSIPRWRIPALVSLAEKLGKAITDASFPERGRSSSKISMACSHDASANAAKHQGSSSSQDTEASTADAEVRS